MIQAGPVNAQNFVIPEERPFQPLIIRFGGEAGSPVLQRPIRCFSSQMTSALLAFRNSQGAEENWTAGWHRDDDYPFSFVGRWSLAQIGTPFLVLTAAIETIAYGILSIPSLLLWPINRSFLDRSVRLLQSSSFTVYWNIANFLVFNPTLQRVPTLESIGRYFSDFYLVHPVWKSPLRAYEAVYNLLAKCFGRAPIGRADLQFARVEDTLFLYDLYESHLQRAFGPVDVQIYRSPINQVESAVFSQSLDVGRSISRAIQEGVQFFRNFIVAEGQIEPGSKELVMQCDPDIYMFVLTRVAYLYVFGNKKTALLPQFLKRETREAIQRLRAAYALPPEAHLQVQIEALERLVYDHSLFNRSTSLLLNQLKQTVYGEQQGSLFITECWQRALRAL